MSSRGSELEAGAMIGGYRIDYLISRGGMGVVYRASNLALNRIYALKVLAPELADDDQFRERFRREIRLAASLHHPNVVAIHYAGEHDGMLFLAMDLIDGTDLRQVIMRSGALHPERAVELLAQITSALDAAHRKGLVHRDVKPANVLISVKDGEEHAYLTDFGLAKRFDNATALTVKGDVVGTVDYMPPEQITGNRTDARSDIYALGCVLFQMLTGKVPYHREHSVATLFAHVYEPPPSLEGPIAASHPTLGPVIAKAMAKDPADRHLSAGDLTRDAVAALQGARYTGTPTIVATGEARPEDEPSEAGGERTQAAIEALQTAMAQPREHEEADLPSGPATRTRAASGSSPSAEQQSASWLAAESVPQIAPSGPETAPRQGTQETTVHQSAPAPASGPETRTRASGSETAAGLGGGVMAEDPPAHAGGEGPPPPASGSFFSRNRWPIAAGLAVAAGAVVAVIVLGSSSKPSPIPLAGERFATPLDPVPTNHVTATGTATIRLNKDVATVTIHANGLLNAAPHAMHIHAGGRGICPPASAARLHNGHLSISTTDGIAYYGDPVVALTTFGDTSPRSIVDFTRYPTTGTIRYTRTIIVSSSVAAEIRRHNAVVVIHGIDYDGSGVYDNVLGASDLGADLTGDSTAPALCGTLTAAPQKAGTASSADSGQPTVYTASLSVRYISMSASPASPFWCSGMVGGASGTAALASADSAAERRSARA
jgi:serine/threonine protein kinase